MEKQWLSITEVAKEMNVSYQAVYKRLNTNFKPYVKKVKGRLMLSAEILDEYKVIEVKENVNQVQYKVENQEIIDALNDHIKSLKKEVNEKDEQIKTLHNLLNQSLKNQSQSNFVLAQKNQQAITESENREQSTPWYKKIFLK
jgi:predicted DNA-binding protein YlxM (UPF0122 family)